MEDLLPFEKVKRNIVVKKEVETNPKFGCKPEERSVEQLIQYGVVNLNKPSGPSSHQVTDYVKKMLHLDKAGHSGTLDPAVIGVLPIALDKATRIVQTILSAGKEYIGLFHLHQPIAEDTLRKTIQEFEGKITQLPPVKSAVKRQLREREVYYFKVLELNEQDLLCKIGCQAGTYIRKIAHDLGVRLGIGCHMQQLVRTKAGPFTDKTYHSLQDLKDAYEFWKEGSKKEIRQVILPFETAVAHLPKVWILDSAVNNICHGSDLGSSGIAKLHDNIQKDDQVALMTLKDELVALGTAYTTTEEMLKKKLTCIKTEKVFMERNTYSQ